MDTIKNSSDYPSCIKIPALKSKSPTSKQDTMSLILHNKILVNANNALISLANEIFGEHKWSHSVSSQTLDFVDCNMGTYNVGCSTFVKVLLHDGSFHEDVGYSSREGAAKGETIHSAKLSSYNDALTKVLSSFGGLMKVEVERLSKELLDNLSKESVKYETNSKQKETKEVSSAHIDNSCSKENQTLKLNDIVSSNTATVQKKSQETLQSNNLIVNTNPSNSNTANTILSNVTNYQKNEEPLKSSHPTEQKIESAKKLSTEELLRMERKRKQMEKQMEFRRLMKEKEMKEKELSKVNSDNK